MPKDSYIREMNKKRVVLAKDEARKLNQIILTVSFSAKIMPCVEGDRSYCQPEANSIA